MHRHVSFSSATLYTPSGHSISQGETSSNHHVCAFAKVCWLMSARMRRDIKQIQSLQVHRSRMPHALAFS